MKIIRLEEFRMLPKGTLFMKYEPCCFGDLMCKGETWEHDFLAENITSDFDAHDSGDMGDKLQLCEEGGQSIKLDFDIPVRDGMFEAGQLFAIYGKEDVINLIDKLGRCLKAAYKP